LADLGVHPRKHLGQNFLVHGGIVEEIRDRIHALSPEVVVEIGPGLGALTEAVVGDVKRLIAIEVDPRLGTSLGDRLRAHPQLDVRLADFLSVDLSAEFNGCRVTVLGSLPYRITSPIIKHLIDHRTVLDRACLITQWEVAQKIVASPGKDGSALGVLVQSYADVSSPKRIRRGAFFPVPDVDSAYWEMSFLERPRFSANETDFFRVVRTLYRHRRKMARRALRDLLSTDDVAVLLRTAGIDGSLRGEALAFDELDRLAAALHKIETDA
jgi:16S rRNA (adenine1518-N6/adenine1519-N6)-dimethyltransferase